MFKRAGSIVEKLGASIVKEHHPTLEKVRILYTFRSVPKAGEGEGLAVAGEAKPLPAKVRDLFGWDAEICLAHPIWNALDDTGKKRLLWHELNHLEVEMVTREEDGEEVEEPKRDKDGRIIITTRKHDISLASFGAEYRLFGLTEHDLDVLKTVNQIYRDYKEGKIEMVDPLTVENRRGETVGVILD